MRAELAKTKISHLRIYKRLFDQCLAKEWLSYQWDRITTSVKYSAPHRRQSDSGFTLMEVMIVVALIAAIIGTVLPRIGNQNNQIKEIVRRFTVLTRELRHRARLENVTYRLVIDMQEGWEKGENRHTYWVEKTAKKVLLVSAENEKDPQEDEDGNPIDPNGFAPDDTVMKKKNSLPPPLFFEDVEVAGLDKPVRTGKIYIHFFPEGLVQEAAVHFRMGENARWTLAIHPLTGKSEIVSQYLELKDIRDQ